MPRLYLAYAIPLKKDAQLDLNINGKQKSSKVNKLT
jgi:hypothetical protein